MRYAYNVNLVFWAKILALIFFIGSTVFSSGYYEYCSGTRLEGWSVNDPIFILFVAFYIFICLICEVRQSSFSFFLYDVLLLAAGSLYVFISEMFFSFFGAIFGGSLEMVMGPLSGKTHCAISKIYYVGAGSFLFNTAIASFVLAVIFSGVRIFRKRMEN